MLDRIGPYEVVRELGRGGMGVVYLARDQRLDRDVAIKSLPEHLASDPARLERFEREAKTLAQLSHPNVVGIHGVEEHEGARYLVLEYAEGESLADRLDRGPLPVDDAIELAAEIAAGVEAAHEAGVIHRDLKPANIIVTPDGHAKVLDFGLARVEEGASSTGALDSPTMTSPQVPNQLQHSPTIAGAILGTAAYMSPEQARGRRVDKRTDIWSFGVVLYEALTGASPFVGETVSDSIGAILHKTPDLDRLPAGTPPSVKRVLERCLTRDKAWRYRDIGDARLDLLSAESEGAVDVSAPSKPGVPPAFIGALMLFALAIGAVLMSALKPTPEPPPREVRRFDLVVADENESFAEANPRISRDGRRVAFVRDETVHVRDLATFETQTLQRTDAARSVFWSPDGKWLGFSTQRGLHRVGVSGGAATRISDRTPSTGYPPAWFDGDKILLSVDPSNSEAGDGGLMEVSSRGGSERLVLDADPEEMVDFHNLAVVPGTDVILYVRHMNNGRTPIEAFDGERTITIADESDMYQATMCWSPTGHILYTRGFTVTDLWAVPFSPERMEMLGDPFLVMSNASSPSVSDGGALVVVRNTSVLGGELVWLDRNGEVEVIASPGDVISNPLPSPDGDRLAFTMGPPPNDSQIWVRDLARGVNTRVSDLNGFVLAAGWSPDGRRLAVVNFDPSKGIEVRTHVLAADGSGAIGQPIDGVVSSFDEAWNYAVYGGRTAIGQMELRAFDVNKGKPLDKIVTTMEQARFDFSLSPDGSLLIYTTRETGQREVYCTRFPDGDGRWQVSTEGGRDPAWAPDGRSVYYRTDDGFHEVSLARDPEIRFGLPEPVLATTPPAFETFQVIKPEPTGERFLAVREQRDEKDSQPASISIIEHWHEAFGVRE